MWWRQEILQLRFHFIVWNDVSALKTVNFTGILIKKIIIPSLFFSIFALAQSFRTMTQVMCGYLSIMTPFSRDSPLPSPFVLSPACLLWAVMNMAAACSLLPICCSVCSSMVSPSCSVSVYCHSKAKECIWMSVVSLYPWPWHGDYLLKMSVKCVSLTLHTILKLFVLR